MTDRYKVLASTIISGRYFTEGTVLTEKHKIPEEDIQAALAGKFVEKAEAEAGDDVEMIDAAPSLTTAHHTKNVEVAETKGDKKAGEKG